MTLNPDIFKEKTQSHDRLCEQLKAMGFEFVPRQDSDLKRKQLSNVIYTDVLRQFLATQKFSYAGREVPFSESSIGNAIRDIDVPLSRGMSAASKEIYDILLLGKTYDETLFDGNIQSFNLNYIDWQCPKNNIFQFTEEFSVERQNGKFARPDVVILVNGIPLVVIECKNSCIDIEEGVRQQCRNMTNDYIPQLFKFAQLVIAMNPQDVLYGTSMTKPNFFAKWEEEDKTWLKEMLPRYAKAPFSNQDKATVSLLSKERLLKLIRFYILYDSGIKKIARYQQFFAVENLIKRIKGEDNAGTKGGVIWHTQGSGKSLTMVMFVKRVFADNSIKKPRFVLVCDRKNLLSQLKDNFIKTGLNPVQAKTGKNLLTLLSTEIDINIICTTINKFDAAAKNKTSEVQGNIFLLVDESHRSHTGEFHTLMNKCLPTATKIGFTGTPLLKKDKENTYITFGDQVGRSYRFEDGIRDKVIVPLIYEGRIVPQLLTDEKIDDFLENILITLPKEEQDELSKKWSNFKALAQTISRLHMIAFDIHQHFMKYCKPRGFKAMVACSSRLEAVQMQSILESIGGLNAATLISKDAEQSSISEENSSFAQATIQKFFENKVKPNFGDNLDAYEKHLKDSLNAGGDLDIIIVKDMLLTGFDEPALSVLYVDKSMKEHSLLQAIARVNRIYQNKDFGLIIDYWGLFTKLNDAMDMYSDENSGLSNFELDDIRQSIIASEGEKNSLLKAHTELLSLFEGLDFDRKNSQSWLSLFDEDIYDNAKELRKDFYERLKEFSSLMTLALHTSMLYNAVGLDKMQDLKSDLKFFQNIRFSLINIHDENINHSKYENGIRSLLNTFVSSLSVQAVVKPVMLHDTKTMEAEVAKLDGAKTKAAYIKTRLIAELEANRYDDPLKYKRFSQRIKDTLDEYKKSRNDDSYLEEIIKLSKDFREGFIGYDYPPQLSDDSNAKAFYGVILDFLTKYKSEEDPIYKNLMGELALNITNSIKEEARIAWKNNPSVHKRINQNIEDLLWDFSDNAEISISLEDLDAIIEKVKVTALRRY